MLGSVGSVLCRQDDEFMGRAKIQTSVVAQRGHIEVGSLSKNLDFRTKHLHLLVFLVPLG